VWDTETDALQPLPGIREHVRAVSFSPDGKRVATAGYDQFARIWNPADGTLLLTSLKHDDVLLDVAFSPDGTLLVTACGNGDATIFDASSGGKIDVLKKHEGQVRKARFFEFTAFTDEAANLKETRLGLLTAGYDGTVRIWQPSPSKKWDQTAELTGANGAVYAVAASGDGLQIVAGGADRAARIYYRDGYALWNLARTRTTRDFTPDERAEYDIAEDE
jgi:WD40 repeat protein